MLLSKRKLPALNPTSAAWQDNETIRQAISIDAGVIQNDPILLFKNREPDYPHFFIKPIEYAAKNSVWAIY
jgi:N5-(carboxyethyl)ornithine synthase